MKNHMTLRQAALALLLLLMLPAHSYRAFRYE